MFQIRLLVLYIAYEQGIKFLKYDEHVIDMIQRIRTPASRIDLLYPDDVIIFQRETEQRDTCISTCIFECVMKKKSFKGIC